MCVNFLVSFSKNEKGAKNVLISSQESQMPKEAVSGSFSGNDCITNNTGGGCSVLPAGDVRSRFGIRWILHMACRATFPANDINSWIEATEPTKHNSQGIQIPESKYSRS